MVYQSTMSRVAEKVKSGRILNQLTRRNPFYYQRVMRSIAQCAEADEGRSISDALLVRSLRWARKTAYGKDYGNRLSDWPILEKHRVQIAPSDFRNSSLFSTPSTTGGSSGKPLELWRSAQCIAAEQAFLDSLVAPYSASLLDTKVAVLRADHVKDPSDNRPPFGVWKNGGRWLVMSSAHLSERNAEWFSNALSSMSPTVLWVYPSAIGHLLDLFENVGATLQVPVILSSSEVLSRAMFRQVADRFGAHVIDYYGQGERVCFASTGAEGNYWFKSAYGTVELINLRESSEFGNVVTADIIATGHWNSAYPLVRYRTGDVAVLPSGTSADDMSAIARGEKPFLGILGRVDDYLVGPGGSRYIGINHIPWNLGNVLQLQVIQDSLDSVRVLVRCRGKLTSDDYEQILSNAGEILPDEIEVKVVQTTELQPATNGKTPFVIRRID